MGALLDIDCSVPQADLKAFARAVDRYRAETNRDAKGAVRSAAVDLVRSLRARTRKSPKKVARGDVRLGETHPKCITGTRTSNAGVQLRRVTVTRWNKGRRVDRDHWLPRAVKTRTRRGAAYVSTDRAATLREARERFGGIRRWGLAKKSWGWFMHALFGRAAPTDNPDAKVTSRMVDAERRETEDAVSYELVNRLDYIRKALQPGALAQSVRAATASIDKKITMGLRSRKFGA